jgi:hypothetical protein
VLVQKLDVQLFVDEVGMVLTTLKSGVVYSCKEQYESIKTEQLSK